MGFATRRIRRNVAVMGRRRAVFAVLCLLLVGVVAYMTGTFLWSLLGCGASLLFALLGPGERGWLRSSRSAGWRQQLFDDTSLGSTLLEVSGSCMHLLHAGEVC